MELVHHLLPHFAAGCLAGLAAAGGVVATNLGSLRDMMLAAQNGWVALVLLVVGFVATFGSAAIGAAIMAIGEHDR